MISITIILKIIAFTWMVGYLTSRTLKFMEFYYSVKNIIMVYSMSQKEDFKKRFLVELENAIKNDEVSILKNESFEKFQSAFNSRNQERIEWYDENVNFKKVFGFDQKNIGKIILLNFRSFISDDMVNEILYDKICLKQMIEHIQWVRTHNPAANEA